jgi:hypothetical protein
MRNISWLATPMLLVALVNGSHGIALCDENSSPVAGSPRAIAETAKLFRRSKDRLNPDDAMVLLTACVEAHDPDQDYDNQSDEFYEHVTAFCQHIDKHRLEPSDVEAIRKWAADSCNIPDGIRRVGRERPMGFRLGEVAWEVWDMAKNQSQKIEPRHAILMSMIGSMNPGYPGLDVCVAGVRRRLRDGREPDPHSLNPMQAFLLRNDNKALWLAILTDVDALSKAEGIPEYFQCGECAQALLDHRNDLAAFRRDLQAFMQSYEKALKELPDYRFYERWFLIGFLRGVWNAVHAYGDERAKGDLSEFVRALQGYYEKRADALSVKWLTQVMAAPTPPPKELVKTVTLEPVKPKPVKK